MIKSKNKLWIIIVGLLIISSCREAFEIEYEVSDMSPILVVEGYIDAGATQSRYKLNYAMPLDGADQGFVQAPSPAAVVIIESEQGEKYYSRSVSSGEFTINHPVLDPNQKYRLQILVGEDQYESDFVGVKISQEISEIEWSEIEDGVQIFVNTADPTNNSKYYRWEYVETWMYFPKFISKIIWDAEREEVRYRNTDELIHLCYLSGNSTAIHIATSEDLSTDAIHRFPLAMIPNLSEKLSSRYSILVRQITMSEASYSYWSQLRESSENLGDIFGPMPSELNGNIVCVTNPEKHVIGMVEAAKVAEKRIYINRHDLEGNWPIQDQYYGSCLLNTEPIRDALNVVKVNPGFLLVEEVFGSSNSPFPTDYSYSSLRCTDCSVKGGKYEAPDFWQAQ